MNGVRRMASTLLRADARCWNCKLVRIGVGLPQAVRIRMWRTVTEEAG